MVIKYRKSIGGYILDSMFGVNQPAETPQPVQRNEPVKSKCPKNSKVEVIWKHNEWHSSPVCSYSGTENCKKCIEKGNYPESKSDLDWECEYCGRKFKTKTQTLKHEKSCKRKG